MTVHECLSDLLLAATDTRALWQTSNDITHCQQLATDQAEGWAAATALVNDIATEWLKTYGLVNALDNNNGIKSTVQTAKNV